VNERGRAGRAVVWGGVLAVVLLVCLAAWQGWGAPNRVFAPRGRGEVTPAVASGPTAKTDAAAAEVVAAEREPLVPAEPALSQLVRVVDEHGAPVADAEVVFTATRLVGTAPQDDIEAELADLPRYHSGSDGLVVLPTAAGRLLVCARKDSRFGVCRVDPGVLEPVPEVVLEADRNLHLRVVGPDGAPRAGVPVALRFQSGETLSSTATTEERRNADDAGLVTVWHAQTLPFWDRNRRVLEVSAFVFGTGSPIVRVSLHEAVPARIDVPCPARGALLVRARLANGEPCHWRIGGEVQCVDPATRANADWLAWHANAGEGLVGPLVLGRRWKLSSSGFTSTTCDGPTADGEQVSVDLVLAEGTRLATIVLLWPDGSPAARAEVTFGRWGTATAGVDGRIWFPVAEAGRQECFRTYAPDTILRVDMPDDAGGGHLDLGVRRLLPVEQLVLVRGSVVDAATGRGVAVALAVGTSRGGAEWIAMSDWDGTFVVEDQGAPEAVVRIVVDDRDYERTEVTVPGGARDVRLELRRLPRVVATVLVDDDVMLSTLSCFVNRGGRAVHVSTGYERAGCLRICCVLSAWEGAAATDTAFEVWGAWALPPPWRVPFGDWRPVDGGYLVNLDLRGQLQNVLVTSQLAGAAAGLRCLFVRGDDSGKWVDIASGARPGFVAPAGAAYDAIAVPEHAFPVRARLAAGENVLDLPPPATIAVRAEGWPDDVRGTVCLCQLTWAEPLLDELAAAGVLDAEQRPRSPETESQWFSPRSDVARPIGADMAFSVVCRGRYRLVPWVAHEDGARPLLDAAVDVEVTTPGQRLDVPLRVDADRVRAAGR